MSVMSVISDLLRRFIPRRMTKRPLSPLTLSARRFSGSLSDLLNTEYYPAKQIETPRSEHIESVDSDDTASVASADVPSPSEAGSADSTEVRAAFDTLLKRLSTAMQTLRAVDDVQHQDLFPVFEILENVLYHVDLKKLTNSDKGRESLTHLAMFCRNINDTFKLKLTPAQKSVLWNIVTFHQRVVVAHHQRVVAEQKALLDDPMVQMALALGMSRERALQMGKAKQQEELQKPRAKQQEYDACDDDDEWESDAKSIPAGEGTVDELQPKRLTSSVNLKMCRDTLQRKTEALKNRLFSICDQETSVSCNSVFFRDTISVLGDQLKGYFEVAQSFYNERVWFFSYPAREIVMQYMRDLLEEFKYPDPDKVKNFEEAEKAIRAVGEQQISSARRQEEVKSQRALAQVQEDIERLPSLVECISAGKKLVETRLQNLYANKTVYLIGLTQERLDEFKK